MDVLFYFDMTFWISDLINAFAKGEDAKDSDNEFQGILTQADGDDSLFETESCKQKSVIRLRVQKNGGKWEVLDAKL